MPTLFKGNKSSIATVNVIRGPCQKRGRMFLLQGRGQNLKLHHCSCSMVKT